METQNLNSFDENQSLQVIKEMITVSQKKLKNNGILFILWGYLMFYLSIAEFVKREIILTFQLKSMLNYSGIVLPLFVVGFTIYYMVKRRNKVQTYIGISLKYVWISMSVSLVIINLIQFRVLHQINFALQHPIFMVVIAFATVTTGGILRYKLIVFGGVFFGLMAFLSSYFIFPYQLLFEALAWLIAFIIPGHYLFAKRNS